MNKETLKAFQEILTETTGYYYPDDRAQYLLDVISKEATTLTQWLDGMSYENAKVIDEYHQQTPLGVPGSQKCSEKISENKHQ